MQALRYTLISDGSSDRALLPILEWLLCEHGYPSPRDPMWADLGRARRRPRTLTDKIRWTIGLYPCELLFVHRDAESQPSDWRHEEIKDAMSLASQHLASIPEWVCVVPVRMQEAWLLSDEKAIRRAAGNPSGQQPLRLPQVSTLESIADPKSVLHELLREASGLHGRRLREFSPRASARLVSENTPSFCALRGLAAFAQLESDIAALRRRVAALGGSLG